MSAAEPIYCIIGSSGGTKDDLLDALRLISGKKINPAVMITHIGGINAVADTTLRLPEIPGGKKLLYLPVPEGVAFREGVANLVIGIAGKDDEHLEMLGKLACICSEMENVERLIKAESKAEIVEMLSGVAE